MINKIFSRLKGNDLFVSVFKGTFWLSLGEGVGQGLIFIATLVVAKILSKDEFGGYGIIRSTIYLFIALSSLRLEMTAIKFVAEEINDNKARLGRITGMLFLFTFISSTVFLIVMALSSDLIAVKFLNAEFLGKGIVLGAFTMFFATNRATLSGVLNGMGEYKRNAMSSVISGVIGFFAIILGAYFYSLMGALWGLLIHRAVFALMNIRFVINKFKEWEVPITLKGVGEELPAIVRFMLPGYIIALMVLPLKWFSDAFLVRQEGGYHAMAVITAALTLQNLLTFPISKFQAPIMVNLSRSKNAGGESNSDNLLILLSWFLSCLVFLPFILVPEITGLFFGAKYAGPNFFLVIALTGIYSIFFMYSRGIERKLMVHDSMWPLAFTYLLSGLALISSAFFLVPKYLELGLTIGYIISYVILALGMDIIALKKKIIRFQNFYKREYWLIWIIVFIDLGCSFFLTNIWLRIILLILSLIATISCLINYNKRRVGRTA